MTLKKIILLLPLLLLTSCALYDTNISEDDSYHTVDWDSENSTNKQKKLSLSQIEKIVEEMTDDHIKNLKNDSDLADAFNRMSELKKFVDNDLSDKDLTFIIFAQTYGYSLEQVDKYLKLGIFSTNTYCEKDYKEFKIFQVIGNSYVLAQNCTKEYGDKCNTIGSSVFRINQVPGEIYFDDKILSPNKDQCVVFTGSFSYETKDKRKKTVPITEFLPKTIPTKMLSIISERRSLPPLDYDDETSIKRWTEYYNKVLAPF